MMLEGRGEGVRSRNQQPAELSWEAWVLINEMRVTARCRVGDSCALTDRVWFDQNQLGHIDNSLMVDKTEDSSKPSAGRGHSGSE